LRAGYSCSINAKILMILRILVGSLFRLAPNFSNIPSFETYFVKNLLLAHLRSTLLCIAITFQFKHFTSKNTEDEIEVEVIRW
jgi:hypothetical protein